MSTCAALDAFLPRFRGVTGAIVVDETGAELYARRADEPFPAASVIKLPILMALYADAAAGEIDLDERVRVAPAVDGSGVLRHLHGVDELSLRDLATLMTIVSDNTATNRVIDRVGIARVNARLDAWGCPGTRLRRAMYDDDARARGLDNVMTPRETALLFLRLLAGELVDRATSDAVIDVLRRNDYDARLLRYVPEGVWHAHKEGNLEGVRNDAGVIRVERAVVVAGFCRELRDVRLGDAALGLLGWGAYLAVGGQGDDWPAEHSVAC